MKALIRLDPATIEAGFRLLDSDLSAGPAGLVDLLGIDRNGALVVVVVAGAPDGHEAALARLLDQYLWAGDQQALLARLFAEGGLVPGAPRRAVIVSPDFAPAFLARLALIAAPITPLRARLLEVDGERRLFVETPAARAAPSWASAVSGEARRADVDPVPEAPPVSVSLADDDADAPGGDASSIGLDLEPAARPFSEFPDPLAHIRDLMIGPPPGGGRDRGPQVPATPPEPEPFESLTTDEIEEFEHFERQRRRADGRSS